jgi:hypothetical protein
MYVVPFPLQESLIAKILHSWVWKSLFALVRSTLRQKIGLLFSKDEGVMVGGLLLGRVTRVSDAMRIV